MPVRIEVIDRFFAKDIGVWIPGGSNAFPNYTPDGNRELLVFDHKRDSTTIYLAPPDSDEVDIEEKGINKKNFKKLKTLKEGGEDLIRETSSRNGRIKTLRFTHLKKIPQKRRLN